MAKQTHGRCLEQASWTEGQYVSAYIGWLFMIIARPAYRGDEIRMAPSATLP
jgi:hypothetical protein